jgi:hypothetical protein
VEDSHRLRPPPAEQPTGVGAAEPLERTSAAIYGTIVSASVIAATAKHSSTARIAVATFVTVLVYWLAEGYAHFLAARLVRGSRPSHLQPRVFVRHRSAMVSASYAPLAVLILSALAGAGPSTAATLALAFATGFLVVMGWSAAQRTGVRGLALIGAAAVSGLFGAALIVLKFALH